MYDENQEKAAMLQRLHAASQVEVTYTKQQNFERAIGFALEEVAELEEQYERFVQSVQHLEVFCSMVQKPLDKDMTKMMQNLRYLIEKNYTKEEKNNMPIDVLKQLKATQDKRIDLLQNIARKYFHRSN